MTARRLLAVPALLASVAVLAVACGSGGPSATPGGPSEPPAETDDGLIPSFALPSFALPSFDLGSFALPSFSSDEELEAMLPDEIGGQTVVKQSLSGEAFISMGFGGAEALEPILGDLGASVDDLSVAFGSAGAVVLIAYQIDGVPAAQLFSGLEEALQAGQGGSVTQISVAGRSVTQVSTAGETTYIYLADDVVFIIGGQVTPGLLEETVIQLPAG